MKSSAKKIELASVDDLFSTEEGRQDAKLEKIQEIPLSELHPFKGHPFKVKDDEAMMETADSIKQYGVLVPAIARPDPEGGYELVAGHRRHRASELAEKETMPVIVRDLDDDAATIIMVDSNLQRESLLPSERAFAYKMKLDAIKHQGARTDLTSAQVGPKLTAAEKIAENSPDSKSQIKRFIRLTELIPELLDMVDEKKIALNEEYPIPDFSGTLMLCVEGQNGKDVTRVFLLVSRDETAPVLTLSDPIFFADKATGEYTVTGTADAGSQVFYNATEFVRAAGDGSFAVPGTLDERQNSSVISLYAQDSVGNQSAPQLALITKQVRHSVAVKGSYAKSSGEGTYAADSTVTISAGTRSGYTFSGWTSDSGVTFDDASAAETTFTMPDNDVTVTANWTRSGSSGGSAKPTYPVRISDQTENGTVTVSPKNASKGDTVTVTVQPDDGFRLEDLTVTDKDGSALPLTDKGDGKYTFTMPAGKVEVKAVFAEEIQVSPFDDVSIDAYYYEAVKWAAKNGITGGIGNNLFGPEQPCSRAQIVTFLWRAAGSPEPAAQSSFADIPADSYYAKAVAWAVENGVTTGTGDGKFSPDATCTRAQAVTFLARAAKGSASGSAGFRDVADNAYYAEAVKWAADNGITNGIGGDLFGSDQDCTRAQIVTFLWRLYAGK